MSITQLDWFKSSYSGSDGDNCIEIATCQETILVRDSKDKEGGRLTLSPTAWSAFVTYATDAQV